MKLTLIGNWIHDTVYQGTAIAGQSNEVSLLRTGWGGLLRVRDLLRVQSEYHFTPTCEATIILSNGLKTSFVDWNRGIKTPKGSLGWVHLSYLDRLDIDLSKIDAEVISADMCSAPQMGDPNLKYVDYLLLGQDEYPTWCPPVKRAVITRFEESIHVSHIGAVAVEYPNIWENYPNPIGAGDAFVAEFLNLCVASGGYWADEGALMEKCVLAAHKYLREQNGQV